MLAELGRKVASTWRVEVFSEVVDQDDRVIGPDCRDRFTGLQQTGGGGSMAVKRKVPWSAQVECRLQGPENA